jgi:hypothetical protein
LFNLKAPGARTPPRLYATGTAKRKGFNLPFAQPALASASLAIVQAEGTNLATPAIISML